MKKSEKNNLIQSIEKMIESYGYKKNSYGIYHHTVNKIKLECRKNNLKIISENGFKIYSKPIVNTSLTVLDIYLKRLTV